MANGNTNVSRLGQINAAGAADALFLKVFSGEVLAAFNRMTVMQDLIRCRTIKNGKSAQFPALGKATAKFHTIGEDIFDTGNSYLNNIKAGERVISVDPALLAPAFVSNWDEMVNHYEIRKEYVTQLAQALSQQYDKNGIQLAILASRAAATVTGLPSNSAFAGATDANVATTATALLAVLSAGAQRLDENDVPEDDRHAIISSKMHWLLVNDKTLINRDFAGGSENGVFYDGKVYRAAGFALHKSNNIPSGVVAAGAENNTYSGDFTNSRGVMFHRTAVGCVKLMDLAFESEYMMRLQGTGLLAKYVLGMGILRPECAIEMKTA